LANNDVSAFFERSEIEQKIPNVPIVPKVAHRLNLNGMLASPHNALGVTAKGVFPDEEMQVTDVWKHIADTMGVFLTDDTRMPIVISSRTAEKLRVRLRSRIIFTFQDATGEMQSLAFRVSGIYRTTNAIFDENTAFIRYSDIFPYTALPEGAVHETALLFPTIEDANRVLPELRALFPNKTVRDWSEINPALSMYFAYTDFMGLIILGIFLFALSFGIINTMLMAVLERTRELGMLGAIGMSKRNIFSMIMLETIFLTLIGGAIGIILGIAVILPTMENGIDLSFFMADQFEDFGFASIVYPIMNFKMFTEIVVLVLIAGILSAIYPARKALKLKPLDAIRS
jgi:ABC-type lipoprotein release transport system permease subunit